MANNDGIALFHIFHFSTRPYHPRLHSYFAMKDEIEIQLCITAGDEVYSNNGRKRHALLSSVQGSEKSTHQF